MPGLPFIVTTPITGETLATLHAASTEEIDAAVAAARAAFDEGVWASRPADHRAAVLRETAARLRGRLETLRPLIMRDNGKTHGEATIDVMAAAAAFDEAAASCLAAREERMGLARGVEREIWREPVGVVVGITPFNAPVMFSALKAAPALAAGNSVVLKPSERAPLAAPAVVDAAREAGVPKGVLSLLHGGSVVAATLCRDDRVDMITLTGGTAAGTAVMHAAAATIKRLLLELGGKSAHIILADADLDMATRAAAAAIFRNAGQRCLSGSRLLVEAAVADEVEARVVAIAGDLRVGDPFDPATQVGALIDERAVEAFERFVARAVADGTLVAAGGQRVEALRPGSFVRPTVLLGARSQSFAAQEELFGPVLTVIRVHDAEEAVRVANDSRFGLTGAVWTSNLTRARDLARRIRTGYFWINTFGAVFGDMPFGGYKASGLGREAGRIGHEAYTEVKSVMIDTTGGTTAPLF
jgi:acyl-CoA reductase-like NAD-dependent aldehyde dehydrogenase